MNKETITYRGCDIETFYDENAESPDTYENDELFLIYDHRDFCVKRKGFYPQDIFDHVQETKHWFRDGFYIFPLYAYIHSGVSLSLGRCEYPFNCPWDTSMRGFIMVKRMKGWTYRRIDAEKAAQSLVEEWNQYLSGDVYGYSSDHGGCSGFYGEEGYEQMLEEAKAEIDDALAEAMKKRFAKLKTYVINRVPLDKRILPVVT